MMHGRLSICIAGVLLSGCVANPGVPPNGGVVQAGAPIGYLYHDNSHPNDVSQASPQAIYNAEHGTWLWPPSIGGRRD